MEVILSLWVGQSLPSRVALVTGLVYIMLNVMRKPLCWPFGIVSCACWMIESARYDFWMDALIQLIYVLTGIWALVLWQRGYRDSEELIVRTLSPRQWVQMLWIGAAGVAIFGTLYTRQKWVDTAYPWWDTTTTVMGIMAMVMVARKFIENWVLWIVYNPIMIWLYVRKDYPASYILLTGIYLVIAIVGLAVWWRAWRKQQGNQGEGSAEHA